MAKRNYKYNNTVDLSNLEYSINHKNINWNKSIGKTIPFTFDNNKMSGIFTIVDYKIPKGMCHPHIYLNYLGNTLKPILPRGLKNAQINQILDEYYIDWAYEIGDILEDKERKLCIINRKREKNNSNCFRKYYQVKCLNCGFDGFEHYIGGMLKKEYYVMENDLARKDERRVKCPCCNNRIVVPGINDITTTAPWMIDYFQNGHEEAKKYSKSSSEKKYFKCIHCNTISKKQYHISNLYSTKGLSCMCGDKISYPNKFAYYLFKQLEKQYDYYENEFSPEWAHQYRYDNYILKTGLDISLKWMVG